MASSLEGWGYLDGILPRGVGLFGRHPPLRGGAIWTASSLEGWGYLDGILPRGLGLFEWHPASAGCWGVPSWVTTR